VVHVYGTRCQHIYASVIVSDNLNGYSRLICLVLETAALCDIYIIKIRQSVCGQCVIGPRAARARPAHSAG